MAVEREGRTAVYSLADDRVPALLDRLVATGPAPVRSGTAASRTCYDHLAGPLGVTLYRRLCAAGALLPAADGTVEVRAAEVLGVEVSAIVPGRRRLAFECLDATEHAPHLAGALGDAIADALFARGWVERVGEGREVRVTPLGAARSRSLR